MYIVASIKLSKINVTSYLCPMSWEHCAACFMGAPNNCHTSPTICNQRTPNSENTENITKTPFHNLPKHRQKSNEVSYTKAHTQTHNLYVVCTYDN